VQGRHLLPLTVQESWWFQQEGTGKALLRVKIINLYLPMKELLRIIYVFVNHREVIFNDESGHVSSVASREKAIA